MPISDVFRRLALAFPDAEESSHMGAADFRLHDRIFATLAYESKELGTLKLTPEQQANFLEDASEYFSPAPGGWGRSGMTLVRLDAPEIILAGALQRAYNNLGTSRPAGRTSSRHGACATKDAASQHRRNKAQKASRPTMDR